MNLLEIVNSELDINEDVCVLEEGLFSVSPAIAMFAFKDTVVGKLSSAAEKISHPVSSLVGNAAIAKEKIKSKTTGKSGDKDNDVVYSLTKEQKKAMAYIYKKYGPQMVNDIQKFRDDVMLPYSIIKRNVSKNHSLVNSEIFGMTKEEYYKYRESGRKKIERKGSYFKNAKELNNNQRDARDSVAKATKIYNDFKDGKIVDLTATNIEKILDEMKIGRDKLNGWTDGELEKTATEIKNTLEKLNDPARSNGDLIRMTGRSGVNEKGVSYRSKAELEMYIKNLQEKGYSYAKNIKSDDKNHHGSFKEAFAVYMLRREEIKNIKNSTTKAEYKKFYEKVLKDAIDGSKKVYDEKLNNYISLKGTIELNKYEKKIWGVKVLGTEYSGNINDWYLKIKPEDFKETKYYKKTDKIIKAEKEFDRALKELERKLKKMMSEEDIEYCRKYKLFNSFLTVKELRNSSNMFKEAGSIKRTSDIPQQSQTSEDFKEALEAAINKEYNSIKDLEEEKGKIKNLASGKKLTSEEKEKYSKFINRLDPRNDSKVSKVNRNKINDLVSEINNKQYTGKTQANEDLKELENTVDDFKKLYGDEELRKFGYDIERARDKLNAFIGSKEE